MTVSNSKHLVGNFNGHLRDCVFLFADEALLAGDKQHVGVLKALITEDCITFEGKFKDAVLAQNMLHIMMASNEEWVVPAGLEARRFFVLIVPPDKKGDHPYFAAIQKEMENGGYEAMLHDLLAHKLGSFDHRNAPATDGLREQKQLSLGTADAWWLDVLHRGYVYKSRLGLESHFSERHNVITTDILFSSYEDFAQTRHERRPMGRETFGRFMVGMGGKYRQPRYAVVGEHIVDVPNAHGGGTSRKAELTLKHRATGYHLGSLQSARGAFADATGLRPEWPRQGKSAQKNREMGPKKGTRQG